MAVLKVLEIMSNSQVSWEDATQKAIVKASETVKGIRSANVQNQSVVVKDGEVVEYRINLKIAFEVK